MIRTRATVLLAAGLLSLLGPIAHAQVSTAITYQGELSQATIPANGTYDFQFRLYSASSGTDQIGPTLCRDNVAVTNGRFSTPLDFGPVFTGARLFVELAVRSDTGLTCSSTAGFVTIGPRQEITVAPFAAFSLFANTSANAQTLGGQASGFFIDRANHTGSLP